MPLSKFFNSKPNSRAKPAVQKKDKEQRQNRLKDKHMQGFEIPEMPKHTELEKRIFTLGRTDKDFRQCHAVKNDGTRCGCQSETFTVFCHAHNSQGYGLFTLAVMAQIDAVKIQRMENK